ncbi:MAG: FtsX-like permease family protein [Candidatus Aminicenantes bacterium]|nr:FtsX-like permease family protein [Candidatus Aminicenantes bacterium]NIM79255.1 FtsX-like permease family protein [Candidatus Aminicenantes bacterium]NIN18541.1 FtsX-like permease family protein [Candidatus Aminicenantes bacterium]NIN42438.1 FtsX-like permease family protein [Candidatus Aminicenantes bacterium]NIN85196.1 FtsX-like permease family protein [Candidatus Aminicenantes bacterium]
MFKNYLKTTLRNIVRHKGYSFINIAGLAIGMACCILLVVYINSELSFDKYHENADRIYRLCVHNKIGGTEVTGSASNATAALALRDGYPEVVNTVRFGWMSRPVVKYKDKQFLETRIRYADDSVFDIFSWPMVKGDPRTALTVLYSIVITEDMAKKYFGNEEPLGKILRFNESEDYAVTGVIKNIPINSHFLFNALCSFKTLYVRDETVSPILTDWISFNFSTYVLLKKDADYRELEKKFPALLEKHAGERMRAKGASTEFFLQPLKEIRLYTPGRQGNDAILYIYIFSAVALFVLLIACVNFMNLSTARSSNRALEVGIRKVLGADRRRLRVQFLMDALILSSFSMVVALILVEAGLPLISSLAGRPLALNVNETPWLIPGIIGLTLFTGILAGGYPAFFLSVFQPINVLKGDLKSGTSHSRLRGILVVTQFAISIVLIIGTAIMINQLNYMKTRDPGFDKEHVVVLPMMDDHIRNMLPVIKKELKTYHGVLNISASSTLPGWGTQINDKIPEGFTQATTQLMDDVNVDIDFIPTLGMKITAGRNFSKDFGADERESVIINETAVKRYGWKEPLGKTIKVSAPSGIGGWLPRKVIGVVKDVHIHPITSTIEPLILSNVPDHRFNPLQVIVVRIKPGDIKAAMDFLKRKWEALVPHMPFNSFFMDASFDRQFRNIERSRKILSYFTFLAIFIACLGLLGMASFTAERRTKEVGIRKVMGATVAGIILLLTKEFTRLVILANLFAWPAAYLVMNNWIRNFPYRTSIGIWSFILSGGMALAIAWLTVSYRAIKAAKANPVDALRYE